MTKVDDLWRELSLQAAERQAERIEDLFNADAARVDRFTIKLPGLLADFSKNLISGTDLEQLIALSQQMDARRKITNMFSGEHINHTEDRAVLHTLLRQEKSLDANQHEHKQVAAALKKMEALVADVHQGKLGYLPTDIVNIGIGGSHLGPALVCDALRDFRVNNIRTHFVSNVDGGLLETTLAPLNPDTTLFVIASKSFTTSETLMNATSAREWFKQNASQSQNVADHFLAASSAVDKAVTFGIAEDRIFPMWDWVGGRYSLWSTIGLPIALQIGFDKFKELLSGAEFMDRHFQEQDLERNLPAVSALIGIWHSNFLQSNSRAVIPYDDRLKLLPSFLQQLEMESNGKQVTRTGEPTEHDTCPAVWGGVGTDAQHAFFQQLHQGTFEVPVDFIVCKKPQHTRQEHHQALLANCLAQSEALMHGTTEETDPARLMIGNHSSNVFVLDELNPYSLGMLLAMYEHRTMFQGIIWDINSFDQFGVELGKKLATEIVNELDTNTVGKHDPSTAALMAYLMAN